VPANIRKALNELPVTLDDTYEQALEGISKEKWQHAYRLFQCLIAAIRPLGVEELAEMFSIEFDSDATPSVMEGFRPENPEEAVLSACSTLISVVTDKGSKIVHFSHYSVKEFLTSNRVRTSKVETICRYYVPLDAAHTILARACLAELLQLDENMDSEGLMTFPLAHYAAWCWVYHAKFEGVASRVQDIMERLFDPRKSYLAAWTRIRDVDRIPIPRLPPSLPPPVPPRMPAGQSPTSPTPIPPPVPGPARVPARMPSPVPVRKGTALYYALLCGFNGLAKVLIIAHGEDVNAICGYQGSPLHAALYNGDLDSARLLLDHGANTNLGDPDGKTPLVRAYENGNLEAMQLLLERGADVGVHQTYFGSVLHHASYYGRAEIVRMLLRYNGGVNARNRTDRTPLHLASSNGHPKVVELLLKDGADIDAQSRSLRSPLQEASRHGHLEVVQILIAHKANVLIRGEDNQTAFQIATSSGHMEVSQLLSKHGGGGDDGAEKE
jgi:ankyrin repeat protein